MRYYPILRYKKDFQYLPMGKQLKGRRVKKLVRDKSGRKAILKYQASDFITSELCSEKIAYEIAKLLGFDCAQIEFAQDEDGAVAVINYLFSDANAGLIHTDYVAYVQEDLSDREQFYTLSNIKSTLDAYNPELFGDFIRIMVFDALIGEQDRHEENWGILTDQNKTMKISPLFDNGDSLARDLANPANMEPYIKDPDKFQIYNERSLTKIYREASGRQEGLSKKYHHFELIAKLLDEFPDPTTKWLSCLDRLDEAKVREIVAKVPVKFLTVEHRQYIIKYILMRKHRLLDMVKG